MRAVVLQSNYIPWKGYFDLIAVADVMVVYDSAQYTKNDWRNRNRLIGDDGPIWLTIPVATAGRFGQAIDEVEVSDVRWPRKHWATVRQLLGRLPHFDEASPTWERCYARAAELAYLHDVNLLFLRAICEQLGITTTIVTDRSLPPVRGSASERVVGLCRHVGASRYLTGPAGLDYLERRTFEDAAIELEVFDYGDYAPYRPDRDDVADDVDHHVSVLDLIAASGPDASSFLLGERGVGGA